MKNFTLKLSEIEDLRKSLKKTEAPEALLAIISDTQMRALWTIESQKSKFQEARNILLESIFQETILSENFFQLTNDLRLGEFGKNEEKKWQNHFGLLVETLEKKEEIVQWVKKQLATMKGMSEREVEIGFDFEGEFFGFDGPIKVSFTERDSL